MEIYCTCFKEGLEDIPRNYVATRFASRELPDNDRTFLLQQAFSVVVEQPQLSPSDVRVRATWLPNLILHDFWMCVTKGPRIFIK